MNLMCVLFVGPLLAACHAPAVEAQDPNASGAAIEATRAAFELASSRIEIIDYGDVLYGRVGTRLRNRWVEDEAFAELLARPDPVDAIVPLLHHDEARVRTLALCALFERENPRLLPDMLELLRDEALTYPEPAPVASLSPNSKVPVEPRTVGGCVRRLVEHYMKSAGYFCGIESQNDIPGFAGYWRERKDRNYCASWFLVRQERASWGCSPVQEPCREAIRRVREDVDRLPPVDRALTILWLPDLEGAFANSADRLAAARSLGRERLLAILRRDVPSDDPDLRQHRGQDGYPCECIVHFVLAHARELLEPKDAPTLLTLERAERERVKAGDTNPVITSRWAIAAASLDPANAAEVLHAAFAHFDIDYYAHDRADLMLACLQLIAEGDESFLLARFDADPASREDFIRGLREDGSPVARSMVAALVHGRSFADLDWASLEGIALAVDGWTSPAVIPLAEISSTWHPLGKFRSLREALDKWPKETHALLDRLASWRKRIEESVSRWAPGSK